jgi:MFS family permease
VLGQLTFGALADQLGRKTIFVVTISLVIIGALGSATCVDSPAGSLSIYYQVRRA